MELYNFMLKFPPDCLILPAHVRPAEKNWQGMSRGMLKEIKAGTKPRHNN